jgi:hypothetical protein
LSTDLYFRVAVRAKEDAFLGLGTRGLQRPRHPSVADPKGLDGRVNVMELKGRRVPVIATNCAPAARLTHQDVFHEAAARRNGLGAAALASRPRPGDDLELGQAMRRTGQDHLSQTKVQSLPYLLQPA